MVFVASGLGEANSEIPSAKTQQAEEHKKKDVRAVLPLPGDSGRSGWSGSGRGSHHPRGEALSVQEGLRRDRCGVAPEGSGGLTTGA